MPDLIALDDPRREDIRGILTAHLAFANEHSPPEDVHALNIDGLLVPEISFFSLRRDGLLLGVGAIKMLDSQQAEVKSMHTAKAARRQGVARAMVQHLIATARERGVKRLYLETGSMAAFAPAHALYESIGFQSCGPFADYVPSRNSCFYSLDLMGA